MVGSGRFWWVGNGSHGAGRKGDKGTNTHQGSGPDKQVAGSHDTELLVKTINGSWGFWVWSSWICGFVSFYGFPRSHVWSNQGPWGRFSFIWHRWPLHMHPVMSPITIYSSVGPQPQTKHRGWRASGQCSRSSRSRITRVNHLAT